MAMFIYKLPKIVIVASQKLHNE